MVAPASDGLAPANSHLLIARLMAAQLGSGLAMAHIQNSDLSPSHACVMILIPILYILCLYIMYYIFEAKLKSLFKYALV
jgi:hypothetical protein